MINQHILKQHIVREKINIVSQKKSDFFGPRNDESRDLKECHVLVFGNLINKMLEIVKTN